MSTSMTPENSSDKVHIDNHVTVQTDSRMYQIVGTILLCGAVGMISYALAINGWLEFASTLLTMFFFQFGRLLFRNGLLALPKSTGEQDESFSQTKNHLRTMVDELNEWQARSPMWRLAAIAAAYTAGFMTFRFIVSQALLIFTNVWIAGALAMVLASLIIAPNQVGEAMKKFRSKTASN